MYYIYKKFAQQKLINFYLVTITFLITFRLGFLSLLIFLSNSIAVLSSLMIWFSPSAHLPLPQETIDLTLSTWNTL